MTQSAFKTSFSSAGLMEVLKARETFQKPADIGAGATQDNKSSKDFMDHLKDGIQEVNETNRVAEKLATDVSTGKQQNIHEAMLALSTAELSFNFMVQVRNKALEAYQEVMRMPV